MMWLFFDQLNKGVIKTGFEALFTQSTHKVIHRVCGKLNFPWKDGKLAPKAKEEKPLFLMDREKITGYFSQPETFARKERV